MGNAFTTSTAAVGLDGFSPASLTALQNNAASASDNAAFLAQAGERIVYTPNGNTATPGTPLTILAVVDRHPAGAITEDGVVLADDVELTIQHDASAGVTKINVHRDTVTVSGRYGGVPKPHTVTAVVGGDAGLWTVRVR